jgi:hypothetical protein
MYVTEADASAEQQSWQTTRQGLKTAAADSAQAHVCCFACRPAALVHACCAPVGVQLDHFGPLFLWPLDGDAVDAHFLVEVDVQQQLLVCV